MVTYYTAWLRCQPTFQFLLPPLPCTVIFLHAKVLEIPYLTIISHCFYYPAPTAKRPLSLSYIMKISSFKIKLKHCSLTMRYLLRLGTKVSNLNTKPAHS